MTDEQRRSRLAKIAREARRLQEDGGRALPLAELAEVELEARSWRQDATSRWFAERRSNFGRPFWTGRW